MRVGRVAVIGAGTMGHGIAYAAALGGCSVALTDNRADALARAMERIGELVAGAVKRGKLSEADGAAVAQRLRADAQLGAAVAGTEIVIEAVAEDLALKRRLFADLQDAAPHDALLATNTSSLSIAAIAQAVRAPGRVVGLHFFNPVYAMRLVEVVTHERSDPGVVARAIAFARQLGKEPILVKDSPGFASSRLGGAPGLDRKSTRLNSSHLVISYAVFCLKRKKKSNRAVTQQL